jgi:hypothetical protein
VVGFAVEAVAYLLADAGTISNWWFLVATLVVIGAMPAAARALLPEAAPGGPPGPAPPAAPDMPLELIGVARPYTPADRDMLDRSLGLPNGGR